MPASGHEEPSSFNMFEELDQLRKLIIAASNLAAGADDVEGEAFHAVIIAAEEKLDRAEFSAARIEPFTDQFESVIHDRMRPWEERSAEAFAYSRKTGREAAIADLADMQKEIDSVFYRMMAIPAATQAGRAAKVRALLVHVMGDEWRGPGPLDWVKEQARALSSEFAGMSADELAAV
jgi:hypothetical protein